MDRTLGARARVGEERASERSNEQRLKSFMTVAVAEIHGGAGEGFGR